jgi:hypothetical protein
MCKNFSKTILSLINTIREKLLYSPLFPQKKTRLIDYKYLMNSSSFRFTISSFLTFLAYIFFRVYLFKISLYFLFLKWYLLKHLRVPQSIKEDLLQVLVTNHPDLLGTRYKLLAIIHNYPIILSWPTKQQVTSLPLTQHHITSHHNIYQ